MSESTPKLLETKNIGKRFPGVVALDVVNFHINQGEIVGLLGENGAGKSTLMKILGGIYQPDDGEIFFGDKSSKISGVNDSIAKGIAFIHQELNMLDNLDVASNVYLGREPFQRGIGKYLRLIDRKKLNADTAIYLQKLGLEVSPETPLNRLSIGQQQLVEIAKALSLNAKILIMDEPTSSLTTTETEKLLSVVRELKSQGVSVIYITHRLGEVSDICDRAVVLRDGKNAGELKRKELTHENMVQLMVGRALKHSYQPRENESDETIFETKNLVTSRYPNKKVSFSVKKGEIFGIAGLVGAGRSELAQTIFGVDSKKDGEVLIENRNLSGKSAREAIDKGVYLIPEDRRNTGLLTEFCIRENITLPALKRYLSNWLVNESKESVVAKELCEKLNVKTASIETLVKNLSGGNQQKVVLAKWLQLDPKLLIFDEPTRGIDVGAKAEIYNLMRGLAKNGVAIIVISSDMEEILGLSDRLAVMREGQIMGILERENCSEKNVMKLAVGG
jgi:ribose transport system ATP-binding protein